jgi:hypothetical protein
VRRGRPAILETPLNRRTNISVVAAIQKGVGIVASQFKDGAFNVDLLNHFMGEVIVHYRANPIQDLCLVMDNCSIHHSDQLVQQVNDTGFQLLLLPP